jgi:signal transduction histidine kinase
MLRRLPIESNQPIVIFARVRLALTLLAFLAVLLIDPPDRGSLLLVIGVVVFPWSVLVLAAAHRDPQATLIPFVALGDLTLLVLLEAVAPAAYGVVRFLALFLIAVHSHFQGERAGLLIGGLGAGAIVAASAIQGDAPLGDGRLAFNDTVFILAALATGWLVGRLRTTESASRLRARRLSRRTIRAEGEVRRRVAESIHDGPVQELIGIDMVLSAASQAAASGEDPGRASQLIGEARELVTKNVQALRDEIVDLGPYAFEELSYATAVENCLPLWKRRYDCEVAVSIEAVELPAEMAGDLFRITQEAVANAGRHANADTVSINLRRANGNVELRVADDGKGFGGVDPLGSREPGHLGLASIRERAELMDGQLDIDRKSTRLNSSHNR